MTDEKKGDKKGMVAKAMLAAGLMWKGALMVKPENREEFMEVVKDPKSWGDKISDAWDWTLIEAGQTEFMKIATAPRKDCSCCGADQAAG